MSSPSSPSSPFSSFAWCCAATPEESEAADVHPRPVLPGRNTLLKMYSGLVPHQDVSTDWKVFDINLFEEPNSLSNLSEYFHFCADSASELLVTLSCFALWNKNAKSNAFGKVIPALRKERCSTDRSTRVFFFDDNLDLDGGLAESEGICNLRDLDTGEFVEFAEGKNGFARTKESGHTLVHRSNAYNNVLIKANILDAMADEFYFSNLISKYSEPGDKILLYMDVNSAIMCNDSAGDKSMGSILLSTMFEFMIISPAEKIDFGWEDRPVIKIDKPVTIKSIVKKMAKDEKGNYDRAFDKGFYDLATCEKYLSKLLTIGEVRWAGNQPPGPISLHTFGQAYEIYTEKIREGALDDGITKSWFNCFKVIREGRHTAILNSFGVDTLAVVQKTVPDEHEVAQVTVNFNLWGERDAKTFVKQFASPDR